MGKKVYFRSISICPSRSKEKPEYYKNRQNSSIGAMFNFYKFLYINRL